MSNRSINYKLQFSTVFVCLPGRVVPAQLFFVSFSPGNPTIWNQSQGDSTLARKALADTLGKQVRTLHIWTGWWLEHDFFFPIILGISIHPNWLSLHHFSEGLVYSTTNQYCYPIIIPLLSIENHIKAILKPYIWNHQPDMFSHSNPTKDPKSWGSPKSP